MFNMFGGFGGTGGGRFEAHYRCYPVTFIDKPEAERGDKIFLPPSALDRLGGYTTLHTTQKIFINHMHSHHLN